MVLVGRNVKDHLVPPLPSHGQGPNSTTAGCSKPCPALNAPRAGALTASLGNLCQCLTTHLMTIFFLTNLNTWHPKVSYWCQCTVSPSSHGRKRNREIQKVQFIEQILLLIYRLANFLHLATVFTLCIINLFH